MSEPTNLWKLGLFLVVGSLVGLSAIVFVGARSWRHETITFRSYFDESVGGLDVGAGVSFRGVRIGNVSSIALAPDGRHVEVVFDMDADVLDTLGLSAARKRNLPLVVPPRLRVQLSTTSITGNKYLRLDIFGPPIHPPPELPFSPGSNYIPAQPSTLKNLEDSLVRAVDQLPHIVEGVQHILRQTQDILNDLHQQEIPKQVSQVLERSDQVMLSLEGTLRDLNVRELSTQTRETLQNLNSTLQPLRVGSSTSSTSKATVSPRTAAELGALVGAEHHRPPVEQVVHRQHQRSLPVVDRDASEVTPRQQSQARVHVKLLEPLASTHRAPSSARPLALRPRGAGRA
jgi:ABC-type transporter Mla subunit MlaD